MNNNNNSSIQIYLRLRPNDENQFENDITVIDDRNVSIKNSNTNQIEEYEFDQVFDVNVDQLTLFNRICRPLIDSMIIEDKDGLLFAYGITSSGKSYTINGTPDAPGLIPRILAYLFNRIPNEQLNKKNFVKSNNENGFFITINHFDHNDNDNYYYDYNNDGWQSFNEALSSMSLLYVQRYTKILKQWSHTCIDMYDDDDDDDNDGDYDNDNVSTSLTDKIKNNRYSLFISFVEIYNNDIYDLLEVPDPKQMDFKRTKLILVNDCNQMIYAKGANEIEVNNLDEAFRVYLFGLQNRQISATKMNEQSSRSHSVFTIKLVYFTVNNPKLLNINQFCIVDLAGLEQANRTENFGKKLCEAGQINNSLMILRACFDAIQKMNDRIDDKTKTFLIPYRESKLTHFLKRFLKFQTNIRMILCVRSDHRDLAANLRVLNFGRKVKRIRLENQQNYHLSGDCFNEEIAVEDDLKANLRKNLEQFQKRLDYFKIEKNFLLSKFNEYLRKHLPPTKLDTKPLIISKQMLENRYDFNSILVKLKKYENVNCRKQLNDDDRSSLLTILTQFRIELHQWNQRCQEWEIKFKILLADYRRRIIIFNQSSKQLRPPQQQLKSNHQIINDYDELKKNNHKQNTIKINTNNNESSSSSSSLLLKKMTVYDRLYYQTPVRYKINQSHNRSIVMINSHMNDINNHNNHNQNDKQNNNRSYHIQQRQQQQQQQQKLTKINKLKMISPPRPRSPKIQLSSPSFINSGRSMNRNISNYSSIIKISNQSSSSMMTADNYTTPSNVSKTVTVKKRQMSDKILRLCRQFEPPEQQQQKQQKFINIKRQKLKFDIC